MNKKVIIGIGIIGVIMLVIGFGIKSCFFKPNKNKGHRLATAQARADSLNQARQKAAEADALSPQEEERLNEINAVMSASATQSWIDELYGPNSITVLSQRLQHFDSLSQVIKQLDGSEQTNKLFESTSTLSWESDGIRVSKELAHKRQRQAGLDLASTLIKLYDRPWSQRYGIADDLNIQDGVAIMDKIIAILKAVRAEPADIQLTTSNLRQLLLSDLRSSLVQARLVGTSSESESYEELTDDHRYVDIMPIIHTATNRYGFSLDEIGLTSTEEILYWAFEPAREMPKLQRKKR